MQYFSLTLTKNTFMEVGAILQTGSSGMDVLLEASFHPLLRSEVRKSFNFDMMTRSSVLAGPSFDQTSWWITREREIFDIIGSGICRLWDRYACYLFWQIHFLLRNINYYLLACFFWLFCIVIQMAELTKCHITSNMVSYIIWPFT